MKICQRCLKSKLDQELYKVFMIELNELFTYLCIDCYEKYTYEIRNLN